MRARTWIWKCTKIVGSLKDEKQNKVTLAVEFSIFSKMAVILICNCDVIPSHARLIGLALLEFYNL